MNQIDKNRLTIITKQIESIIDEIEEIQNNESSKYYGLSIEKKQSVAGRTLENNCWLLQPLHDKLEEALSKYDAIKDLIDLLSTRMAARSIVEVSNTEYNLFLNQYRPIPTSSNSTSSFSNSFFTLKLGALL